MTENEKILIMCEGPNELEIINILLKNGCLQFSNDDLLNLQAFHARQIDGNVKTAINLYQGDIIVLRIGDTLRDCLKIKNFEKIKKVYKICTKPEIEMLLIIAENLVNKYDKSKKSPKIFAKENISLGKIKYNNSTKFYSDYFGGNIEVLVYAIKKYKEIKKHKKDEFFLADLLKQSIF